MNSSAVDIRIVCTRDDHERLKDDPARVLAETTPVGIQLEWDGAVAGHMRNCACRSTIMLTPEQHAVLLAHETHLAGPGDDGAESGD